jgi:hypothetical protein
VLGTKNLGDILSERESIALEMQVIYYNADNFIGQLAILGFDGNKN